MGFPPGLCLLTRSPLSLCRSLFNPEDPLPTNFEGPVTIDMPAGIDVPTTAAAAAVGAASPSGSSGGGGGHPKLRLEMVSEVEN